jgi:class 3 adenylate cyclase/tetratricopeptide (TPR) repeat protein
LKHEWQKLSVGDEVPVDGRKMDAKRAAVPHSGQFPIRSRMNDLRHQLEQAIAVLEAQRVALGDDLLELKLAPLKERIAALQDEADAQQLRQVTVLFTDLVGSTSLSQHLDPEDVGAVMDGALARFAAIVEQHQGKVLQYAGDSLLAVFGTPVALEDDAERAVLAGLAILSDGRAQAIEVQAHHGLEGFSVRVGVNTGVVLLGGGVNGVDSVRGMTVNIAARMEQTAPPGAMRISQETYRQVRGRFNLLDQPPLIVKGSDEPLRSYLVQGTRVASDRGAARGVDGIRTRMVGRDEQFAALQQAFTSICHADRPSLHCITVVGDAGLGKSRLLAEFRRWVITQSHDSCWLEAHAGEQHMGRPFHMLRAMLSGRMALLDSDPPQLARDKWLDAASQLLGNRADAAVLGHQIGLDFSTHAELRPLLGEARQLRDRAFFHASQLLQVLAARHSPVVAWLDDLHWVDDGTLDFVEYLMTHHPDIPLLVIALARPSFHERRPGWHRTAPCQQRIDLTPLDSRLAGDLVDSLLGRLGTVPAGLRTLITHNAEGNPFYMEELVNMLIDQDVIETAADEWQFRAERMRELAVPATLVGVLQARVDTLPASERRTAQLASVVGYRFWDDALLALGASQPEALQALIDRDLIVRQEPSSLEGMREFAFKHHTLHQVIYESVLKRVRRPIHAKAARWLIGLPGATPVDLAAEHFERGEEYALALDYWQLAAESAAARFANHQALAHSERALALVAGDDLRRRYAITVLRCTALEVLSDRERRKQEVDALHSLAEKLADPASRSEAWFHRSRHRSDEGDWIEALAHARQAIACAQEGEPLHLARAHSRAAQCLLHLSRHREASEESTHALHLSRAAGSVAIEGTVLNELAMLADMEGDYSASIDLYEQALARHREVGHRNNEAGTLSNLGYTALTLGDYDSACSLFVEARDIFLRIGKRQNEGITLVNLGIARLNQGRPAEASSLAREALQLIRVAGDRLAEAVALRLVGQAALAQSATAEAVKNFVDSRNLFQSLKMRHLAMEPMAGLAREALDRGDGEAALVQVEAILELQAQGVSLDGTEEPMRVQLICHQVLVAAGDQRALPVLDSAYRTLVARAHTISDPTRRQTYLQAVPSHREIIATWNALQPAGLT